MLSNREKLFRMNFQLQMETPWAMEGNKEGIPKRPQRDSNPSCRRENYTSESDSAILIIYGCFLVF
jgi:hypothetical protein